MPSLKDHTAAQLVVMYHDALAAMLDTPDSFVDTLTRQISTIIPCHGFVMVVEPDAHETADGARAESVAHVRFDLNPQRIATDVEMRTLALEQGHDLLDELIAGAEHDIAWSMEVRYPHHAGLYVHWIRSGKEPRVAAAIFRVDIPGAGHGEYGEYGNDEVRLLATIEPHILNCVRIYQEHTRAQRATFDFFAERCGALASASGLTTTEQRVLRKMVEGETNKAISVDLGISLATVKTHISHILQKTGCRNRTDLIGRHFSSKRAAVGA